MLADPLTQFIRSHVTAPPLLEEDGLAFEYRFNDTKEGRERLNRAFDRLFDELMRRRKDAVKTESNHKKE